MIDIHSHILPGLDDGPRSLEESVAMLRIAEAAGTTDIVASPHASIEFHFEPAEVERKLAEVRAAAGGAIRIHTGCDFHLTYDNIQDALAHPRKYTINGQCYLLVEFSDLLIAKTTDEIFVRLGDEAGISPIITHPERNWLLQRRLDQLARWVQEGCYLQVTAQSLQGRFGAEARNFARELMKRGLVHFIASDAHDPQDRTPRLDEARRLVAKQQGEEYAERLFVANPRAVLEGGPVEPYLPPPERRRRWWFG